RPGQVVPDVELGHLDRRAGEVVDPGQQPNVGAAGEPAALGRQHLDAGDVDRDTVALDRRPHGDPVPQGAEGGHGDHAGTVHLDDLDPAVRGPGDDGEAAPVG